MSAQWTSRGGARDLSALLRALAILCIAGLALHQLRYLSWLGDAHAHAGGHRPIGPRTLLAPGLAVGVTGLLAVVLVAVARHPSASADRRVRMRNLWLIASGGLLVEFAALELLQGLLHPDHPFGLHGVFGHGGWIVVPLALLLGGMVALAVAFVRELDRRLVWLVAPRYQLLAVDRRVRPRSPLLYASSTLADNRAGRSPPLPV